MSRDSHKKNYAQTAVVTFIDTLGKIANSNDRMMVRDAGAIAPLISLMMHGMGDAPGRAAAVLRVIVTSLWPTSLWPTDELVADTRRLSSMIEAPATRAPTKACNAVRCRDPHQAYSTVLAPLVDPPRLWFPPSDHREARAQPPVRSVRSVVY